MTEAAQSGGQPDGQANTRVQELRARLGQPGLEERTQARPQVSDILDRVSYSKDREVLSRWNHVSHQRRSFRLFRLVDGHLPVNPFHASRFVELASKIRGSRLFRQRKFWAACGIGVLLVITASAWTVRSLRRAEVREQFVRDGADPVGSTPEELAALFRREIARYAKIIATAKVTAD